MGYSVYWANNRWQGYGIPAYCDYPGCRVEIDRGMGYQHEEDNESSTPNVFCCEDHKYIDISSFEVEKKEHPDWLSHILTHESWEEWRQENPLLVDEYTKLLEVLKINGR